MITILYILAGIVAFFFLLVVIGMTSMLTKKDRAQFDGSIVREAVRFIAIITILLFIFLFIYPTPYRFLTYKDTPLKYNWVNGETEILKIKNNVLQWSKLDE